MRRVCPMTEMNAEAQLCAQFTCGSSSPSVTASAGGPLSKRSKATFRSADSRSETDEVDFLSPSPREGEDYAQRTEEWKVRERGEGSDTTSTSSPLLRKGPSPGSQEKETHAEGVPFISLGLSIATPQEIADSGFDPEGVAVVNPLRPFGTPRPPISRQGDEQLPDREAVASSSRGSETRGRLSRPPEGKPGPVGRATRTNEDREGVASGRGRAALLLLVIMLAGCGGGAKKPTSNPAKPKEEPTKSVATGPVEIVQKEVVGEEKAPGSVAWRVAGKRSQITFAEGKATGMLYEVEGTLFGEKTETKFTAKQGKVDQKSDSLELTGDITATARDGGILRADKLIWLKERGLVRALGHVRYSGGGYQAGEFEELLATSDLKKMGTPDMFPSTMELKKKK